MTQLPRRPDDVSETAIRQLGLQVQDITHRLLLRELPEIRLPETILQLFETLVQQSEAILRSVATREVIGMVHRTLLLLRPMVTAAAETEKALTGLPKRTQRELTVITVRCPGGSLLLRVMWIPDHLPGARYAGHLVLPTSAATYEGETEHPGGQVETRAWFLNHHEDPFNLRCRCHPGVILTPQQLRGESPPPPGIRVLES